MLLEVSGKGALIHLEMIPKPDLKANAMTFEQWIRCLPWNGICVDRTGTTYAEIARRFSKVGMTATGQSGSVDASRELRISV